MSGMQDWLSDQFWSGNRWVVLGGGRPRCYANYADAAGYCRSENDWNFRVRILGSLLKTMTGRADAALCREDSNRLKAAVGCYPLRLFVSPVDWQGELLKGNFYPMVWEKLVHPLLDIRSSVVLWQPDVVRVKCRELYVTEEFSLAMPRLIKEIQDLSGQSGTLYLFGRLLENGDVGDKHATITFYRVTVGAGVVSELTQVHDPAAPFVRSWSVFVRYHAKMGRLTFYDGSLKRIRPGDEPVGIDLQVFDFQPISVSSIMLHGNEYDL